MCALTVAPPPSSDPRNNPSWAARAAKMRMERPPDGHIVLLSFCDLHVSVEDVTTVGQALARCSAEEMLRAVMRHEAGWRIPVDTIGSRAHHMLMGKIASALEAMRSLADEASSLSSSREGIVGPLFRFASVEGGPGLEHRVEAVVFPREDTAAIGECLAAGVARVCTWDALRTTRCGGEDHTIPERLTPDALCDSHTLLARLPWERVLALPLWLPSDLSEEERWAILAKVFWSMTYRGFMRTEASPDRLDGTLVQPIRRTPCESVPWPANPVLAVLDHNCWVDTLEAWSALFDVMRACETRP